MLEKLKAYRDSMAWAVEAAMKRGDVEGVVAGVLAHDAAQKAVDALESVEAPTPVVEPAPAPVVEPAPVAPEVGGTSDV